MKTNRLIWTLGWITMGSLAALQGCGGDDDDGGDSSGGKGGEAGEETGGTSSGGTSTGGRGGTTTGGTTSGGTSSGGTSTGGMGGAEGGVGGEDTGGGAGGSGPGDRQAACDEYCQVYYEAGCEAFDGGYYGTEMGCANLCAMTIWELGEDGDAAGNSVHCRLTHANNALNAATAELTETHCGHARAEPTGVCVP